MRYFTTFLIALLASPVVAQQGKPVLEVWPKEIPLFSKRARVQIVVTERWASGETIDLTRSARVESNDEAIVTVKNGMATPHGNGKAIARP